MDSLTFDKEQMEPEQRKKPFVADLENHDLPEWMSPIAEHKKDLTILQGLSGKMCWKVANYADALQDIRARNGRVDELGRSFRLRLLATNLIHQPDKLVGA